MKLEQFFKQLNHNHKRNATVQLREMSLKFTSYFPVMRVTSVSRVVWQEAIVPSISHVCFCGWRCVCGVGGIHAVFFIFDMFFTRLPLPMNSAVTFPVPATVNKSAFTRHTVSSILRFWGLHGSMFVLLKSLSLWANACTNRQNRSTINKTSGSRGQSTQSATTLHSWTI